MKVAAEMLRQWHREDPVRLLQAALWQAECLAEMAPELAKCGQSLRSTHPLQMSLAIGAAGVQLGPRALAVAADLNKAKGLSMRKACAVFRELRDCPGRDASKHVTFYAGLN